MTDLFEAAGLTPEAPRPLADRLRPASLDEVVGQDHLLGPDGPIRRMAEAHRLSSMILWGPPGTGKTTIARLLATEAGYQFQQLSAVFSGVADLKKAFETARGRRAAGQATLLFVDADRAKADAFKAITAIPAINETLPPRQRPKRAWEWGPTLHPKRA